MKMKHMLSVAAGLICSIAAFCQVPTEKDVLRAVDLVGEMTLDEKIGFISGYKDDFHTLPVERLGIPSIRLADGPQGVRNDTESTLYASGVAAAASWNKDLVREMGVALGQDSRARGVHILLGPGVNIARSPLCGRNFEYFGEDPCLAAETAVAYIQGVQSQGVMATIKHFALNNQEYNRHHINSVADERTINEIYFPAFRAAVERAGVASVMTSYNPLNGVHSAENNWLLEETLRGKWNFKGFVMSDWTSTYVPVTAVENGVDLEMPRAFCYKPDILKPMIEKGQIRTEQLDAKIIRILATFSAFGFLDRPQLDSTIALDNPYSRDVAYRIASESVVLLKNNGILPLKKSRKVSLSGPNADVVSFGGGSGRVAAIHKVTLKDGLVQNGAKFSDKADVEIIALGFSSASEKENSDRTFALPSGQEDLVRAAKEAGKKVILVVNSGGAVDLSRLESLSDAILWAWYPGQEGGKALADIIYGKVSPSGKLPVSFPLHIEDNPAQAFYLPMKPLTKRGDTIMNIVYGEGVFNGYRGYTTSPLYPFGYGLSYADFQYGNMRVEPSDGGFDVKIDITNTGKVDAKETVQLYVGENNPVIARPKRELKAFEKVMVPKGKTVSVTLHLDRSAFAWYDVLSHDWKVTPGTFTIEAASSATDIRASSEVVIK